MDPLCGRLTVLHLICILPCHSFLPLPSLHLIQGKVIQSPHPRSKAKPHLFSLWPLFLGSFLGHLLRPLPLCLCLLAAQPPARRILLNPRAQLQIPGGGNLLGQTSKRCAVETACTLSTRGANPCFVHHLSPPELETAHDRETLPHLPG